MNQTYTNDLEIDNTMLGILLGIVSNFILQIFQLVLSVKNLNCTCFGHRLFSISDKNDNK